jgi:hypothetical protein
MTRRWCALRGGVKGAARDVCDGAGGGVTDVCVPDEGGAMYVCAAGGADGGGDTCRRVLVGGGSGRGRVVAVAACEPPGKPYVARLPRTAIQGNNASRRYCRHRGDALAAECKPILLSLGDPPPTGRSKPPDSSTDFGVAKAFQEMRSDPDRCLLGRWRSRWLWQPAALLVNVAPAPPAGDQRGQNACKAKAARPHVWPMLDRPGVVRLSY